MTEALVDQLFDALRKGDGETFSAVVAPFRERILCLAKQRLGEREAEDIVQETLGALWEKRGSVEDSGHLLPFLFQILRYKIGNAYLRSRRTRQRPATDRDLETRPADATDADPERRFEANELREILQKAIETCARENQLWGRVLQLLREEWSRKEIQSTLGGISMTAIDMRILRARKRLGEILKQDYGIEL